MTAPSACIVFNNVNEASSIGALALWSARTALEAGWRVSVVARDIDPALRGHVEWLPLHVPRRFHAYQWYRALPTVRKAMGGRRWDVVHTQQPQLAPIADILHLHYLVQAARELTPPPVSSTFRQTAGRLQARLTERGESSRLRHLPEHLQLVPVSDFLREQFVRLYGEPSRCTVLPSPAPPQVHLSAAERARAREGLVGRRKGLVVGFLGGADPRKGGAALLDALAGTDMVALVGGGGLPRHPLVQDADRVVDIGYVHDIREFFAACDVFAAVSHFDPGPLTALEAAAHGVPVVGTVGCGAVVDLAKEGGALCGTHEDIRELLVLARSSGDDLALKARRTVERRSSAAQGKRLIALYESVHARKGAVR